MALLHFNPTRDIEYLVVETPGMVSLGPDLASAHGLKMVPEIPRNPVYIFFSSGTIQCLEAWEPIVSKGLCIAGRCGVFARNSLSERHIVRLQRASLFGNGVGRVPSGYTDHPVSYPHRTVSLKRLVEVAAACGLNPYAEFESQSGALPFRDEV